MFDFNASLNDVIPLSPILLPVGLIRMEEWIVYGCYSYVVSLCSPSRSKNVSVAFDFNASLNDVIPASPMSFTVDLMRILLTDGVCALFLSETLSRSSRVSVVFNFNASLNEDAPLSPTKLSVDLMRMVKERIANG